MDPLLTVSLLAGVLSFEYRSSLRLYLSAPLVSGWITGLLLGYPLHGLVSGVMMQLIFLGSVRLRGRPQPDLPVASAVPARRRQRRESCPGRY